MKCQKCRKRAAKVHITEIDRGKERHYCGTCARALGVSIKSLPARQPCKFGHPRDPYRIVLRAR